MPLDRATLDKLIAFRRELHRQPELSGVEARTSERVARFLAKYTPDEIHRNLGGHGLAAVYRGAVEGPTVLIRCELDGLPIEELSDLPYRSEVAGKAHLCGHDGHMAMVAGLAPLLQRARPTRGRAVLLFQPAEETGAGAKAVIEDPAFAALKPDYAFALHNLPGLPLGSVAIKQGVFNCASQGLWIKLTGKTSHASAPEDGISPAAALCELITGLNALPAAPELAQDLPGEFTQVTITHANLGEAAFGIAPGEALLMATLRSESDRGMAALRNKAEALIAESARVNGLQADFGYEDIFAAASNHPEATELLSRAFEAEGIPAGTLEAPMRWSEDFGQFGTIARSAMFVLGSGAEQPQLHNPDYDFPDALIETGTAIFHRVLRNLLGPSNYTKKR